MGTLRLVSLTVVIGVLLDQLSKLYIDSHFKLYESVTVLENFFHITYIRNRGAAFGILSDSPLRLPFFIVVTLVAIVGILWYLRQLPAGQKLSQLALGLILSGAIGNLIDRLRFGEVIDFIDVHWYSHHWPAFNVADSAICIGVGLLLLDSWRTERRIRHNHVETSDNKE
ncbi:MAG: signal peptidase II [Desulfuromonadales bacterium]|jgi:signal peptidase II|nr:signal peptidase II [Desulfuromonadales bacterium]